SCSTMVDPVISFPTKRPIFVIDLSGENSNPMIPDSFISNHLKGKTQSTKLKLTSDGSDRVWEVELDGNRFAGGWKSFSVHHSVRNDDVLSFRHDGDMVFHCLSTKFARSNGLNNRQCKIDLVNEDGKSWTLDLRHNKTTGQPFISGGWTSFCKGNGLNADSFCRFELVQGGTKPVLQLCPNTSSIPEGNSSKAKEKRNVSETDRGGIESETATASMNHHRIVTLELKPYMLRTGQLRLPVTFARENGIKEVGEITIMNKIGVEWKLHLANVKGREQYYIRGLKDCFIANSINKIGDSFTFEVVRGGTSPILKICSEVKEASFDAYQIPEMRTPRKVQALHAEEGTATQVQKRCRVSAEGGPSQRTRASNKSSVDPGNLQRKQPPQPRSISDQVSKVKQSVVDTLAGVRRFRSELEIKEQNLEASLLEIDTLGEKIMGISQFFNINQV
ncbi:unnamed protein product, partial [Thlaspi arvense]